MSKSPLLSKDGTTVDGTITPEFSRLWNVFHNNFASGLDTGAAFCVYYRGRPVVDIWGGLCDSRKNIPWQRDTLCMCWSVTKALTALCLARLADRGHIEYERPVSHYWPEFAQNGKADITVEQLVSHQAGLISLDNVKMDLKFAANPNQISRDLAKQKPVWPPGSCHGYHAITIGWYIDQVIRRVDDCHRSTGVYFKEEFALPLDLDIHIGLSEKHEERVCWMDNNCFQGYRHMMFHHPKMFCHLAGMSINCNSYLMKMQRTCGALEGVKPANCRAYREVEQPHVNGMATARSLARIVNILANQGRDSQSGIQMLSPAMNERMLQPIVSGMDQMYQIDGMFSQFSLGLDVLENQVKIADSCKHIPPGKSGRLRKFHADELECPSHTDRFLFQKSILWGDPWRAYKTCPNELMIAPSTIPGAGYGVIARTFIKKYTWLGEYEGEVITNYRKKLNYVWVVHRGNIWSHYIDGENIASSNYLRWMNCPRKKSEENVQSTECMGKIWYIITKDVAPGQELLVFYGSEYAAELGIKYS